MAGLDVKWHFLRPHTWNWALVRIAPQGQGTEASYTLWPPLQHSYHLGYNPFPNPSAEGVK